MPTATRGRHHYLHCDEAIIDVDFLGKEVGANGGFVLVAELLVYILVHQRSLPHTASIHKKAFRHKM